VKRAPGRDVILETMGSFCCLDWNNYRAGRGLPQQSVRISSLFKMQLILSVVFIVISSVLTQTVAAEPSLDDSGLLSRDSIEIDVQMEIESPHGFHNVSLTVANTTYRLLEKESNASLTGLVTHALCETGNFVSLYNKTSWLPTAATQSLLSNFTVSPSATGQFRTPSQTNFDPFFNNSCKRAHPETSVVLFVVTFYLVTLALS
jgi:hypothetical protein